MKLVIIILATFLDVALTKSKSMEQFGAGNIKLTAALYGEVLKECSDPNFVFSPLSIEIIMALVRSGAKGKTAEEITTALHLPDQRSVEKALKILLPALQLNTGNITVSSANKIAVDKGYSILDGFKNIATKRFNAEICNVDFRQPSKAANLINQWVEEKTNNKIKNLVDKDKLRDVVVILVNALYFSGKWMDPFSSRKTKKQYFYTSKTSSRRVEMMTRIGRYKYYECQKTQAKYIIMPFADTHFSMTIALPNEIDGLSQLENNMEELLSPKNFKKMELTVMLPKFETESSIPVKSLFEKLGIRTMFTDFADFSDMSVTLLKVSDVVQKAFINVTECGVEAAAATEAFMGLGSAPGPQPPLFKADHPFSYFIKYKSIVLFAGRKTN